MRHQLTIRPAQPSDKELVLKFCEHTFDWGDYVPRVWDFWIKEKHAQLFTATLDNKPVGIMRVSIQKPGEAWLQAARTDPSYRRKGIATALTDACLEWAKTQRAKAVLLVTDSDNHAAQQALKKLKFIQVSDFLIMHCEKLQAEKPKNSRWSQKSDTGNIWKFLRNSDIFKKSAGLYTLIFTWMSLDEQDLAKFIANKKAIIHESHDAVDGLVLIDEEIRLVWEEKPFQTCYIDGDHDAIVDTVKFFKTYSHQQGVTNVYAFACNTPVIIDALSEAGFCREDSNTELVYKKKL